MYAQTTHVSLLQALAAGNRPQAWTEFCDRYGDLIRGFARRQGVKETECDDVLQEVLLGLTRDMPDFQYDPARGRFRGYLKTVTLHVIYKRRRRIGDRLTPQELDTQVSAASQDGDIENTWETEWRNYHVRQAMRTIEMEFNEKDRQAFQHYAMHGQDAKKTGETLGLTVDQVYQAKSRITRRLGELIESQIQEEG